jgi:hypothetical protein
MRIFKTVIAIIGIFLLLNSYGNIGSNSSIKIGTQTWAATRHFLSLLVSIGEATNISLILFFKNGI